jgi:uncharacterized protein (UPF0332 family)
MRRPETDAYLDKARRSLQEAHVVAAAGFPDAAGRAAYLAAYHVAQGLIFDRTGKAAKTHRGVRSEFARLTRNEPRIEKAFLRFLARAYNLKETADYAIGYDARVSIADAEQAIEMASRFLEAMSDLLSVKDAP